jgi:transcriptional antiterminator NusG
MEKTIIKKWFMIHTYSGYEKKVKTDLEQKIETLGKGEIVTRILVPEEESMEMRRGKQKLVARKLFPGYVMVEMLITREESADGINFRVDSDAWYIIRNTNGVTGFVGVGSDPIPMEDEEVDNIFRVIGLNDGEDREIKEAIQINFGVEDYVELLEGGLAGHEGRVAEIDMEHKRVKVMVEMFGRMTPVEVGFDGVKKA